MTDLQDTAVTIDHMYCTLKIDCVCVCVCVRQASVVNQSLTTDPELWTQVEEINQLTTEVKEREGGGEMTVYLFFK